MSALRNYSLEQYVEDHKYKRFSKFKTVDEFNNHFDQMAFFHKDKFTKGEYKALKQLRNFAYSEKSPTTIGVAWPKLDSLVDSTYKDWMFGISRSTFNRMLRKAKKLGLITVIPQFRKNKYKSHNVYAFNRFEELTPEAFENVEIVSESNTNDTSTIDTSIPILLYLPTLKDKRTYAQAQSEASKESKIIDFEEAKTDYQKMKDLIGCYYPDTKIASRFYSIWKSHTEKSIRKPSFDIALRAIMVLMNEVKRRMKDNEPPLDRPTGYYNGIVKKMIAQWVHAEYNDHDEEQEENKPTTADEIFEQMYNNKPDPIHIPDFEASRAALIKRIEADKENRSMNAYLDNL